MTRQRLTDASDEMIWAVATAENAVVVTKDEDFVRLFQTPGGARLVWVRIGNCDNPTLVAPFEAGWAGVMERLNHGEGLVEFP